MLLRKLLTGGSASDSHRSFTSSASSSIILTFLLISALGSLPAQADDILQTSGFTTCLNSDDIVVTKMNVVYDRSNDVVTFDIAGSSLQTQNVTAILTVSAYGKQVYSNEFSPCDKGITQLCPMPQGSFDAADTMTIPADVASMIPAIAFQIPDLDGTAKLQLNSATDGTNLACLQSTVSNGKTADQPGAKYVTAGIAAAALACSLVSAGASAGAGAGSAAAGPSPNFGDVMFWFQSVSMNGMMSVNYPTVYRSFTNNFAWSTGLIPWEGMQRSIDNFRKDTGGSLDQMSVDYLKNATLVYTTTSTNGTVSTNTTRRSLEWAPHYLYARDDDINGTVSTNTTAETADSKVMTYVHGIQAYVEKLQIPSANTFMTVLLIFCIVMASLAVCILLFKVILEIWALFASFPKGLRGFRKRYWGFLAGTFVKIVLILYGTWVLYCLYQFRNGDSWGANVLAAITLTVFTSILAFFAIRIFILARRAKMQEKSTEKLFEDKPLMRRYGLFYDQYKSSFWWVFIPLIAYAFAKAAFIALGDGHGVVQTAGQLGCEVFLLILLIWNRPYNSRSGNILNIIISCVRVLSVGCLIVFVDQLGIAADTRTVTGVALIAIQSTLTAALAILIAVNAIIVMCKENPHKKRRKELEKMREENLTDLGPMPHNYADRHGSHDGKGDYHSASGRFPMQDSRSESGYVMGEFMPVSKGKDHNRHDSGGTMATASLMKSAAPISAYDEHRSSYDNYTSRHVQV
ncbi:hypothetical protein RUND412_010756 [Rhizina undulata]